MAPEGWNERSNVKDITNRLLAYCRAKHWVGYDPYDALNSRVYGALPFLDFKLARLALTQAVKRCPINIRPLLLISKSPNAKGIALFLSAFSKLLRVGLIDGKADLAPMAELLLKLRIPHRKHSCWGYNFNWQSRSVFIPKESPNIICSTFAANALLDAYEKLGNTLWLEAAQSSADFVLKELFHQGNSTSGFFRYAQAQWSPIHNANLFGAALLCRISRLEGNDAYLGPALEATHYTVSRQHEDGSWSYGESSSRIWVDNFHTGFNLVALNRIKAYGQTTKFDLAIIKGLEFYKRHFFRNDGAPRYYHNATYPIDIHSVAQSVITLVELKEYSETNIPLAHAVLDWGLNNLWDPKGFFYYQKRRGYNVRIPFMRWSQAWMLLALATILESHSAGVER